MANLRQIRSRIRSVQNTQKITRAMQMVAGAKLRRAQEQLFQARPYVDRLEGIVHRFLAAFPSVTHPLLMTHDALLSRSETSGGPTAPTALIVVTSDTGLCGSYNERLIAKTREALAGEPAQVVLVGRKGLAAARRLGWPILARFTDAGGKVTDRLIEDLAATLTDAYRAGRLSRVHVVYTRFLSALRWQPTVEPWLPVTRPEAAAAGQGTVVRPPLAAAEELLLCEPTPAEVTDRLLPTYITAKLRRLLLEAVTSEHSARMVAMKAATDNAAEMIDGLTLFRNKVRQAAITKEISEIVAGAEALKG